MGGWECVECGGLADEGVGGEPGLELVGELDEEPALGFVVLEDAAFGAVVEGVLEGVLVGVGGAGLGVDGGGDDDGVRLLALMERDGEGRGGGEGDEERDGEGDEECGVVSAEVLWCEECGGEGECEEGEGEGGGGGEEGSAGGE